MIPKCIVCSNDGVKLELEGLFDREYGVKGAFAFVKCPVCGVLMLSPMPTLTEIQLYYPLDYHGYAITDRGVISLLYKLVDMIRFREYRQLIGTKGNILDIGCADAPYADLLKKKNPGISLTGVEFNEEIAERGRKKGRNIVTGTIMDIKEEGHYDLIIMNNLIEHVIDPINELRKAHSLLRPGGYILMETPNTDCWDYSLFGRYWGSLHVPRHTYLFSEKTIGILAEKCGFDIVKVKYLLSTDNWALSVQNLLQSTKFFRVPINNGRAWYYKYLLFAFIPVCIFPLIFKKTGAIVVTLQKK